MVIPFQYAPGATPLDPDEAVGLIPKHITTQGELNDWEQTNILLCLQWLKRQRKKEVLDEIFLRELHRQMFGKTWKWAGKYRCSDKNIGVDWRQIPTHLHNLVEDVKAQIDYASYPPDETAIRFHHRLVSIHPFANGNGRHARFAADLLIQQLGGEVFTWGGQSLVEAGEQRKRYLAALRAADARDYRELLAFARSQ